MLRSSALRAGALAVAAAGILGLPSTTAQARPPYCVQQAWYYADGLTGNNRQDPRWSDYNIAFQDYNDCNGPNACNDFDIICLDPPA